MALQVAPPRLDAPGLAPIDLLHDLDDLGRLLATELSSGQVLDAFLLACGMNQIAEDWVHCSRLGRRRALRWQRRLDELGQQLADAVAGSPCAGNAGEVAGEVPSLPASLRRQVLRLPDCFRAFDQQPGDCALLAEDFAERWPHRGIPLLVVGVRTSGSYLAPLLAAYLARLGFTDVRAMTCRPGHRWLSAERSRLRDLVRAGGLALLIDDPPVTGNKLAGSASALEAAGLDTESVVLMLPLFYEAGAVPQPLRKWPHVVLPSSRWCVNQQLEPEAVRKALSRLAPEREVGDVTALPLQPIRDVKARPLVRSHLRRRYRVEMADASGRRQAVEVYAKGTGIGYFGRHSLAVAERLRGLVPDVLGWERGLLFRAGFPESERRTATPAAIVRYVEARRRRLGVEADRSLAMTGRNPAWEFAAGLLADGFGRGRSLAAPALRRMAREAMRTATPSVVDGSTAMPHWFGPDARKVDFDERAFSVWDVYSYDAVLDLAIAAADHDYRTEHGDDFGAQVRGQWPEAISDERWLLYRYLHLAHNQMHFRRLLRQGPGQLQTHAGTAPASPDVQEPGFQEAVLASYEAGERALARVLDRFAGRGGRQARMLRVALDARRRSGLANLPLVLRLWSVALGGPG